MSQNPGAHFAPEIEPCFAAAHDGILLLKGCKACGQVHYYPRSICPLCGSDRTVWRDAAGGGELYSFSISRRASPPYCIAYVRLDEGPIILTNIVGADFEALRIGQRVALTFKDGADGRPLAMFTPSNS